MKGVDSQNIPEHIAIIMDGNGRWAKKRFLPRAVGHREGVKAVERTLEAAAKLGKLEASTGGSQCVDGVVGKGFG